MSRSVAEAKASADIVRIIGETLALRRQGRGYVGLCPFHTEGTPSFTVFEAGHFHCFGCNAHGDVFDWLTSQRRMSFPEAKAYLGAGGSGVHAAPVQPAKKRHRSRDSASHALQSRRIWADALDPRHSIVVDYLHSRGVELPQEPVIRFHAQCPCGSAKLPAMIALLTDPVTGEPTGGIHRTFLARDGSGKADIERPKMALGPWGVVRLYEPETVGLGIAEGIETALSVAQRIGWGPVWATCGTSGMAKFPVLIECTLHVFVDRDDKGCAGLKAAEECTMRWADAGRETFIHEPPDGLDWAEAARGVLP